MKRHKREFSLVFLIFLMAVNAAAQDFDLTAEGKVVARGKNTTPVEGDDFKLTSYRLETIPEPMSYPKPPNWKPKPSIAVRLVLIGEFKTGGYIVWLNGAGFYAPSGTGRELSLVKIGSRILFQDGLEIAVSRYGLKEPRVLLPEPFVIPDEFKAPAPDQKKFEENIKIRYRSCSIAKSEPDEKCVIVRIYTPVSFESSGMNAELFLQIGGEEFVGTMDGFIIPWKQFELLKDGDWMVVKRERGPFGGVSVGKLNKSLLKEDKSFLKAVM